MTADIDRPERQVDVIDGGDMDPESGRSLSVGQLQVALRAAHERSSRRAPLDSGSDDAGDVEALPDSNSRSRKWIRDRQTKTRPYGLGRALSGMLGLQDLGLRLAARRKRLNDPASDRSLKTPGVGVSREQVRPLRSIPVHGDGLASRLL